MNRTENLKAYSWTAVASGVIGLLVGVTALLVHFYEPVMLRILLASVMAGVIIGIFSRALCLVLVNRNYPRPVFGWILVFVMIGVGTMGAAWYIGKLPPGKVVILVAVAEIFGMVVAYGNYQHFIYINEKLSQKQEQFRDGSFS